jgi:hypothetical protein
MKPSFSLAKVWFAFSLAALVFVYGVGVGKWEWFPYSFLDRATDQAQSVAQSFSQAPGILTERVYSREGVTVSREKEMQPGLTLITSSWKNSEAEWEVGFKLIDEKGRVVHDWLFDRAELFGSGLSQRNDPERTDIHGSHLLPNGDVVFNIEYVGTVRADVCGKVKWTLSDGNHHSVDREEGGNFWIPGVSSKPTNITNRYPEGVPGLPPVWVDRILRVNSEGEILDEIYVLDVLYSNNLESLIVQEYQPRAGTSGPDTKNITHLNDVEPLPSKISDEYPQFESGDLLVSLRNIHLVFVFDPESENIKWYESGHFIQQHDPDFIGDGWIGVFDNRDDFIERGKLLGGSRIVALQPHTDSTRVLFPTSRSDPFYTDIRGKWQMIENRNMLLTESAAGRVVEVVPDGDTVWEWIHSSDGNSKIPYVSQANRIDLTREEVASWSCSSVDSASASAQKPSQNQQTAR